MTKKPSSYQKRQQLYAQIMAVVAILVVVAMVAAAFSAR
jgi:hypothetical protein